MCTKSFWEKIAWFLEHEKQYRLLKVERSPCDTWKPLLRKPLCFAWHIHQCILRAGEENHGPFKELPNTINSYII